MSAKTLKEIFSLTSIDKNLDFEQGLLDEGISTIIRQIINKQLRKGQYKLNKPTLKVLKKLHNLGVETMFGVNLEKIINSIEAELSAKKSHPDLDLFISTLLKRSKRKKKPKFGFDFSELKLETALLEIDNPEKEKSVETSEKMLYSDTQTADTKEKETVETPLGDAADDQEEVAEFDILQAFIEDNLAYGEFDPFLGNE